MAYQITQSDSAEITMVSTNCIAMESDNVLLGNSVLGVERVNDWDMTTVTGNWYSYNAYSISQCEYDGKTCCMIVTDSTGIPSGIQQTILPSSSLSIGKKYKVSILYYGLDLAMGEINVSINNNEVCNLPVSDGEWITIEANFVASVTNPVISVYVDNNPSHTYYIHSFSIKEIVGGDIEVNGSVSAGQCVTGNFLSPNFVPALFGLHWNADAVIVYEGGSQLNLPSMITWTCSGHESVTQSIQYNSKDQPDVITTLGVTSGRTATETLTWSGENLTGYSITFS